MPANGRQKGSWCWLTKWWSPNVLCAICKACFHIFMISTAAAFCLSVIDLTSCREFFFWCASVLRCNKWLLILTNKQHMMTNLLPAALKPWYCCSSGLFTFECCVSGQRSESVACSQYFAVSTRNRPKTKKCSLCFFTSAFCQNSCLGMLGFQDLGWCQGLSDRRWTRELLWNSTDSQRRLLTLSGYLDRESEKKEK